MAHATTALGQALGFTAGENWYGVVKLIREDGRGDYAQSEAFAAELTLVGKRPRPVSTHQVWLDPVSHEISLLNEMGRGFHRGLKYKATLWIAVKALAWKVSSAEHSVR